jgi:hypothetical protein
MKHVTTKLRIAALLVTAVGLLAAPDTASARTYTVVSCDSALAFGSSAGAWARFSTAGRAYETCPTNGGFTAGISNRMTGQRYAGLSHSGHRFTAPPGTTISRVRLRGRFARGNCARGTIVRAMPSRSTLLGLPNGRYCAQTAYDYSNYPLYLRPPPGTTSVEQLVYCGASSCSPGATMHTRSVEVTIDDPRPPSISLSGPLVSGRWVSGRTGRLPTVNVTARDGSGVSRIAARIGSVVAGASYPCNWSRAQPCPNSTFAATPHIGDLADGRHTVSTVAVDAAGNTGTAYHDVYVDNTPPDPILPQVIGGSAWRRANSFAASWSNSATTASPITRAHWKICNANASCPVRGARTEQNIQRLSDLKVPGPGDYRLSVWLEDAAGNQREANAVLSVPLRFDPDPPELAFVPPDPDDPLRVAVNVNDRHSGLASGEIEMRASGSSTWHGLSTARQGSQLVAYVDDERFRRGLYQFRAHATDQAGNEASTNVRTDGAVASLRLPARIQTRLAVGVPRRVAGRGRHRARRLVSRVRASVGRYVDLSGRLTNTDGQPLEGATIEAFEIDSEGARSRIGFATTRFDGTFRYVIRATHNREVLFRYGGSQRIATASTRFALRVPATSSIRVSRPTVRNGASVVFTGRVATRPVPSAGKLLEMQAHFRGRWRTFSTLRTDRRGAWRFRYRFGATLGRVRYRFRTQLPLESGYPFIAGHSRVAHVVVLGP